MVDLALLGFSIFAGALFGASWATNRAQKRRWEAEKNAVLESSSEPEQVQNALVCLDRMARELDREPILVLEEIVDQLRERGHETVDLPQLLATVFITRDQLLEDGDAP